ncbi:MAG: VanZ family protein [Flavobacterium sp.]|uniref:VanZ family protein n=1 Tax=Flavobacterium sp. TaxID=239 RepID=UPI0022BF533C|nr:VanZ family protein [Flavobacterium sp.]MCZ8198731.1 VanZ family protein [Flavobacterium sp.]
MKILKKLLFHPILIYTVIFFLECIPIKAPVLVNEFPKEGDNFKSPDSFAVYHYTNNGKYSYTSPECYFRFGNPPFSATYEQGGIKTISTKIANKIPLMGSMCGEKVVAKIEKRDISFDKKYLNTNYLLDNFSVFSHIFFYMLLAFSILLLYKNDTKNYLYAFVACFVGGGLLELVQHYFIEGRTATFEDLAMNTLGSIIAIVTFWILIRNSSFFRDKVLK